MRILSSIALLYVCGVAADRGQWSAFNGKEYYISPSKSYLSYDEAKRECKKMDSNLAKVDTLTISNFLRSNIQKGSGRPYAFFIGLTSPFKNETYVWEDGMPVIWANWNKWEPNNFKSETCVTFGSEPTEYRENFAWNNLKCSVTTRERRPGFICQKTRKGPDIKTTTIGLVSTTTEYATTSSTKRRREYPTTINISAPLTSATANHDTKLTPALVGAICGSIVGVLAIIVIVCLSRKRLTSKTKDHQMNIGKQHEEYAAPEDSIHPTNHQPSQLVDNELYGMSVRSEGVYHTTVSSNLPGVSLRDNEGHEYAALGTKNVCANAEVGPKKNCSKEVDKQGQKRYESATDNTTAMVSNSRKNTQDDKMRNQVEGDTNASLYTMVIKSNRQNDNCASKQIINRTDETSRTEHMEAETSDSTYSSLHKANSRGISRTDNDVYNVFSRT